MKIDSPRVLAHSWLLLVHQLSAKPAYLRVKIWRRLQDIGAVAVKNAVHALPMNEETQEDFEWLLREIREGGGEAFVCEARLIDGLSDGAHFKFVSGKGYRPQRRRAALRHVRGRVHPRGRQMHVRSAAGARRVEGPSPARHRGNHP